MRRLKAPDAAKIVVHFLYQISAFDAFDDLDEKIPLKRGKEFTARDILGSAPVTIINESLARRFWPAYPNGLDPVGQLVLIGASPQPEEIVGIVADVHQGLDADARPGLFRPLDQASRRPRFRQLREFVEASELVRTLVLLGPACRFYVIVRIDGKGGHRDILLARFKRVITSITLKPKNCKNFLH